MSFGKELVNAIAGEITDDYEARLAAAEKRSGELAADLLEALSQRRRALAERDEARAEVVRLGRDSDELLAALREANDNRAKMLAQHREALDEIRRLRDQLRFADARIARRTEGEQG